MSSTLRQPIFGGLMKKMAGIATRMNRSARKHERRNVGETDVDREEVQAPDHHHEQREEGMRGVTSTGSHARVPSLNA